MVEKTFEVNKKQYKAVMKIIKKHLKKKKSLAVISSEKNEVVIKLFSKKS